MYVIGYTLIIGSGVYAKHGKDMILLSLEAALACFMISFFLSGSITSLLYVLNPQRSRMRSRLIFTSSAWLFMVVSVLATILLVTKLS